MPAETITHSKPGDLFVHRNIANLFSPDDDNTMSVLEYAVNVLKVDDVIVCGHYGCGGVRASLLPLSDALPHVNRRIAPLCALARTHSSELDAMGTMDSRIDRLAELSVLEQVSALRDTAIVRDAERPPARSRVDLRSARWPHQGAFIWKPWRSRDRGRANCPIECSGRTGTGA